MKATHLLVLLLLGTGAAAQSSLEAIEAAYEQRRDAAVEAAGGILSREAHRELTDWFIDALRDHLGDGTNPPDRVATRLVLASAFLGAADREKAKSTLSALETDRATMTELLSAAELATTLRMPDERTTWIDAALAKAAPFDERMHAGLVLMTRLLEVERAEALFAAALEAAADDEDRARVLWHRASATREREDLEDGAYEAALGELVDRYADTLWGGIAKDRLHAMAYEVGVPAVPIAGVDLDGEPLALTDLRGKVALVWYWASWSDPCRNAAAELAKLVERFGERGFAVLGVCLDDRRADVEAFREEMTLPGRSLFDGKGLESPHALRNNVEHVPHLLLVGRDGEVAGLRLSFWGRDEVAHVARTIEQALGN